MSSRPLLVVGLDGVDFRYLDRFSGDLPNIGRLRESGVEAPLQSTHPPWTGSAWPSMYTGVDPSHHGVYDFFDYREGYPDEVPVVTRNDVRAPAIWNYLTELGLRSIVVNVPITHPAEEIAGTLIPGYLAPSGEDGYPSGIREEVSDAIGQRYEIYSDHETAPMSEEKIDGFESLIRARADAAEHLLSTEEWDFAFVQVQKTDTVFHTSSSPDHFRQIYRAADDLVGRLVETREDLNVVVVSDHGMGPVTGTKVYVNELLSDHGLVETTTNPTNLELSSVKEGGRDGDGDDDPALARVVDVAKRVGVDPKTGYRIAERLGVEGHVLRLLPDSLKQSLAEGVDWRASRAYCRRTSEQGVRVNLEGRDSEGVVSPDEYEAVRDEIIEALSNLETDDGKPVFEFVARREEVYDGPYAEDACDVLFRTTKMNHSISTNFHGRTLAPLDTHDHKRSGVFVAAGPDVETGWESSELSLVDVAPVVFSLLGRPVPDRMTGTAPPDVTTTPVEVEAYGDVPFGQDTAYSQDQEAVTERLDDLGYL